MSDITARPVLSRQAFTIANVTFLDRQGLPYTPTTVEKQVLLSDGSVITDWTDVGGSGGFDNGSDVEVTAEETEMQDESALFEKHIVLIVGDRDTDTENPLRVVVQVQNRGLVP